MALTLALTACGGSDETAGRNGESASSSASPSPTATSLEAVCVRLITYWAHDQLKPGGGSESDYQQKGLSDGQNTILLDVVEQAEAARRENGDAAARALVKREVEKQCAQRYEEGADGGTAGWPQ